MNMKTVISVLLVLIAANLILAQFYWIHDRNGGIDIHPLVVDFGEVNSMKAANLVANLTVTNSTDKPVHITNTRASCGCTAVQSDGTLLSPGKSMPLHIAVNWSGRSGKQSSDVVIQTSHPDFPTIRITLQGTIAFAGSASPSVINFGRMIPGERRLRRVTVTLDSNRTPVDSSQIVVTSELIRVRPVEELLPDIPMPNSLQYDIEYTAPNSPGVYHEDVKFRLASEMSEYFGVSIRAIIRNP